MIGAAELALMQDDGFLVNTARSWVVDQDALLAELQSGRLRAALDVYDQEPLPADHPYRSLENVILTPHVAGARRKRTGGRASRSRTSAYSPGAAVDEVTLAVPALGRCPCSASPWGR